MERLAELAMQIQKAQRSCPVLQRQRLDDIRGDLTRFLYVDAGPKSKTWR
jgi:hypothetical protein